MTGGYTTWQNNTASSWWVDPGLRKNVASIVLIYSAVFSFGYDGSLLNGLQGLPSWNSFFFPTPDPTSLGLISACYYFPNIFFAFGVAYASERFGRRNNMLVGAVVTLAGSLIITFAQSKGMLAGGRAVLGVGSTLHGVTAPVLLSELAHPRLRSVAGALYLTNYYCGSIIASWLCFAMADGVFAGSSWNWRFPCLFQGLGPLVLIAGWYWLPESPRWLMSQGRETEAIAFYERHHANGSSIESDELVRNEVAEIREAIDLARRQKPQGYRSFLETPGNRHRLLITLTIGLGGQLSGSGLVGYYLPSILALIGITESLQVQGFNGGLAIMNLCVSTLASTQVDRLGRRILWISGMAGMLCSFIVITGLSGAFASNPLPALGSGTIAGLFIFFCFYDCSFTALPSLYLPECLPFELRSKGMAIYAVSSSVALAFNQFVNPIALSAIAWKYYLVYVGILAVLLVIVVLRFPETKGLTPENIVFIFDKDLNILPMGGVDGAGEDSDADSRRDQKGKDVEEMEHLEHR